MCVLGSCGCLVWVWMSFAWVWVGFAFVLGGLCRVLREFWVNFVGFGVDVMWLFCPASCGFCLDFM